MSRVIKFRLHCERTGKVLAYELFNTILNSGYYWVDASEPEGERLCNTENYFRTDEPFSIPRRMQFTGLLDANGVEIYEGDILKLDDLIVPALFEDGSFQIKTNNYQGASHLMQDRAKRFVVIGNIHQNPELLK